MEGWTGDDVGGTLDLVARGSGFQPGSTVDFAFGERGDPLKLGDNVIRIDDAEFALELDATPDEAEPPLASALVGPLGTFDVGVGTYWPFSDGAYTLAAVTRGGGPAASTDLIVPCAPTLSVTPTCVSDASAPGAPATLVRVTGSG